MSSEKQDGFSPKRATNIDGFFARSAGEQPRSPAFRAPVVKPQSPPSSLADMPRRGQPQPVLSSAATFAAQPAIIAANPPVGGERRRHRHGQDLEPGGRSKERRARKPRSWKRIFKRAGLALGVLVVLGGMWFGFKFYRDIAKLTGNKNPFALLSVFHPVPLQNQSGRVNILVAGNSADDPGHNGADLTDSIMVLSVDTNNNTAFLLSVPRDLWVDVPGAGYEKINAAITDGGMPMLQQVVQQYLGVTIDYRALVNYEAFKDLVNTVGGITIDLQTGDPRGLYDSYTHIKLPNGEDTLNGQEALELARARCDAGAGDVCYGLPDSDFDRTLHQRQMAIAIKNKASEPSIIANPFKVSELFDAVGNNVTTNLQLDEIETLYTYMKKINDNNIGSYNVNSLEGGNTTLLANYTSDGQESLIPAAGLDDWSVIQAQIQRIMSSNPIAREGANVEVLNATDVTGLAGAQEDTLTDKGVMTVSVADALATQDTNTLIDNSGGKMPNTLAYLKKHYDASVVTNTALTDAYPNADFILILGQSAVSQPTAGQ